MNTILPFHPILLLITRSNSQLAEIYGSLTTIERYYCNFGVNPDYVTLLNTGDLQITASDNDGEVRGVELPDHPFFIGTLFVPQMRSTPSSPHPLVTAFLMAVIDRANRVYPFTGQLISGQDMQKTHELHP